MKNFYKVADRYGCNGCSVQVPIERFREAGFIFPHEKDCTVLLSTFTDCKSTEGITVGLIDAIIAAARVLRTRSLEGKAITEALKDLRSDDDVAFVMALCPYQEDYSRSCVT